MADPGIVLKELEDRRREAIRRSFTRLDPVGVGAATGIVASGVMFVVCARLWFGNPNPKLSETIGAMSHYLFGFDEGVIGILTGVLEVGLIGAIAGWVVATVRNGALRVVLWKSFRDRDSFFRRHALDEIG